jgi:hypothetical protein
MLCFTLLGKRVMARDIADRWLYYRSDQQSLTATRPLERLKRGAWDDCVQEKRKLALRLIYATEPSALAEAPRIDAGGAIHSKRPCEETSHTLTDTGWRRITKHLIIFLVTF